MATTAKIHLAGLKPEHAAFIKSCVALISDPEFEPLYEKIKAGHGHLTINAHGRLEYLKYSQPPSPFINN